MSFIPVNHSITVQKRISDSVDDLGVPVNTWSGPETHSVCAIWVPSSDEPFVAGHDRVTVDLCVIAPVDFPVGPHDRVVHGGKPFECVGEPQDHTTGPWWNPGVKLWTFKRVES